MSRDKTQSWFGKQRCHNVLSLLSLCACAISMCGCPMRRTHSSIRWATAVQVRPTLPARPATQGDDPPDLAPDLRPELPPVSPLATERSVPVKPRVAASSSPQNGTSGKPDAPVIVPELTLQESTAFRQQTNESLSNAERNLSTTKGKSLNPMQADLASKVRGFIADAREAARAGDWARARNLAKKAQALSEELAGLL